MFAMRKHALFIAVALALLAYWLWLKFRPVPILNTSVPLTDNGDGYTLPPDSADTDFGKFLSTGTPIRAAPLPAAVAGVVTTGDVGGDDGFTGGGGGQTGGAGAGRAD